MSIPINLPQRPYIKAFYKLDEVSGNRFDSSNGDHTATDINTVGSDTGKINLGASFVAANLEGFDIVDHSDLRPTGAFTVACWLKTSTASIQNIFQSFSNDPNVAGFDVYIGSDTYLTLLSGKNTGNTASTDYGYVIGTINLCDGVWHHCIAIWDGSNLKVYTDNGNESITTWANAPAYAAANYVRIGYYQVTATSKSRYVNGLRDEIILWNGVALSAAERTQVYNITKYNYVGGFPTFL